MSHLRRDTAEAKTLAAKATTIAQDTKVKLTSLEARVTALEKGEGTSSTKGHGKGAFSGGPRTSASSDWEQLGTTEGNTVIVGGFRSWASREERQKNFDKIRTELPNELAAQIFEVIVPAAPGRIVIVKLTPNPLGTKETRIAVLAWCKKFKEIKMTGQREGESEPREYFAMPSKPFEMRQRDTRTTNMMAGLKALNPELDPTKFKADLANGRVFYERTLLAERHTPEEPPSPRMNNIRAIFPGVSRDDVVNSVAKVLADREKERKGQ